MADFTSLINNGAVRGAYRTSQNLSAERQPAAAQDDKKTSFADIVREAAADAAQTVREADTAMEAGVRGEMDTQSVVEATLALESTVKVAVSVRDKFVEAYQEVMRMPI